VTPGVRPRRDGFQAEGETPARSQPAQHGAADVSPRHVGQGQVLALGKPALRRGDGRTVRRSRAGAVLCPYGFY